MIVALCYCCGGGEKCEKFVPGQIKTLADLTPHLSLLDISKGK